MAIIEQIIPGNTNPGKPVMDRRSASPLRALKLPPINENNSGAKPPELFSVPATATYYGPGKGEAFSAASCHREASAPARDLSDEQTPCGMPRPYACYSRPNTLISSARLKSMTMVPSMSNTGETSGPPVHSRTRASAAGVARTLTSV